MMRVAFLLLWVGIGAWCAIACTAESASARSVGPPGGFAGSEGTATDARLVIEGAEIDAWNAGALRWQVAARRVGGDDASGRLELAGASFRDVQHDAVVTGETGSIELETREIVLERRVVASVPGVVVPGTPAGERGSDASPVEISADRFLGRGRDGLGVFEGHVTVRRGELVLRCERLTVAYSREKRDVERMVAEGNVQLETGKQRCTAARVTFETRARRVVLEGDPVLVDGRSEMRGTRIAWELDGDRVDCERCRIRWLSDGQLP